VRDGADDQDHDDIPNVAELSRNAATGHPIVNPCSDKGAVKYPPDSSGRVGVNPFNPCMPNPHSRTCARHPEIGTTVDSYLVLN